MTHPAPDQDVLRRVMVGMSGGVDSAVAALTLKEQGCDVAGLFMKNWDEDDGTEYCTAEADHADAAEVCERLGIELFAANFAAEYWDNVFAAFLADYRAGRTPNPDVLCNREIKFRLFVDYAAELGYPVVATGHYARRSPLGEPFRLLRGVDRNKDQTYFLQAVPSEQLKACVYPIGHMEKPALRQRAEAAGLPVHDKKDSTGICFIGERRFADFLARYLPDDPGPILDMEGAALGEHRGLAWFTIGQRQGIGIGGQAGRAEKPWYVARKDQDSNALYVTQNDRDLLSRQLRASGLNRIAGELPERCTAKTRYRQPDQPCSVDVAGDSVTVTFEEPQRAVTPGQYVAFYLGEECLGGARIDHTDRDCP